MATNNRKVKEREKYKNEENSEGEILLQEICSLWREGTIFMCTGAWSSV